MRRLLIPLTLFGILIAADTHLGIDHVTLSEAESQLFTWETVLHDEDEKIVGSDAEYTVDFEREIVTRKSKSGERAISAKDVAPVTQIATQARLWTAVRELTNLGGRICDKTTITTENRKFELRASTGEFLVYENPSGKNLLSMTPESVMCPSDIAKSPDPSQQRVMIGYMSFIFRTAANITDWFSSIVNSAPRVKK